MGAFKAAFINEIEKMYRKKKALVVVILSLLVIVIGQLMVSGFNSGWGFKVVSNFPLAVLQVFVNTILPLFTALVSIDVFSGEFNQNTMKIAMLRPVKRFKLFSAKIAAITFFVFANLFIVMILSILTGLIFNSASLDGIEILKTLMSYILALFPIMALSLTIVFLANVFKNSTAVFFISILMFIVFKGLSIAFSRYSSFFITSMFEWYDVWTIFPFQYMTILRQLLIILSYGIMFYTAGFYLFDKKDL